MNPFVAAIKAELETHPDECYVTDHYIAVLVDDVVLIITGEFAGKTPDEINDKIGEAINSMTR